MTASEEISLRPLSLRPGGGNPFAGFAMGAGLGLKNKVVAGAVNDEKKKPREEVIKYSPEFLMKFAEGRRASLLALTCTSAMNDKNFKVNVYTRLPSDLQFSNLEIVLDPSDPHREAQRALLQRVVADEADERDWRARAPTPTPAPTGPQTGTRGEAGGMPDSNAPRIQRATDLGRTAWAAGAADAEGSAQTLRKVKGILNKLTPEKFERLLSQLIPLITGYEVLQDTIKQVFENAIAQPTFVAMYADLCAELDAALPEFEGPQGLESFKKMLANTCQEEYEATEAARDAARQLSGEEREEGDRQAKQRLLGNVRLIAELFKKGMVNDRIMLLILADLLGPPDDEPGEDPLEAACEMLTIAGATLDGHERSKARLEAAFAHLNRLSNSKTYPTRIRFVVKDVLDLRAQHWVNRRETFTAKKLEDIRIEAQAELGIVDVAIPGLEPLLPRVDGVQSSTTASKRGDDMELFPALRGRDLGRADGEGGDGKYSAFLGEFVPENEKVATPPEASGESAEPRAPRTDLSNEQRESLSRSLYSDYLSSRNINEATAAAQELLVPGFGPVLVNIGITKAFDAVNSAEQDVIAGLIVDLASRECLNPRDIQSATEEFAPNLEDISLDVPSAPRVIGIVLGGCVDKGLLGIDVIAAQARLIEGAEARRNLFSAALKAVRDASGEDKMISMVKNGEVDVLTLLQHDAEFEPHLPDAAAYVRDEGLSSLLS